MTAVLLPQELIRKKRDGLALDADEIRAFVAGVTDGSLPDYQVAAMLMAMFLRGMDDAELFALADAMVHSGEVIDLSRIDRPKVDKHSTGGVGDKISLPLAPAVAACGVAVPMVSGRGLGHTGGTLDKLESIPGFTVDLGIERFIELVDTLGVCMIGQTERLAPADRRLYALRDVTGTVESVPLIASSIMSKKLAEGIDALVLDCKVGHGAFMTTLDDARALGRAIRVIGEAAGKRVSVMLTDMDAPIGQFVGNALEVKEAMAVMYGMGPADTRELTVALGGEMLYLAGVVATEERGRARIAEVLDSGHALAVFARMIEAQGGNPRVVEKDYLLPHARGRRDVLAPRSGYIQAIRAADIGKAALVLGAGRTRKEDPVDPSVGIALAARIGERVEPGQILATLAHNDRGVDAAEAMTAGAFVIVDEPVAARESRILEVLR